MTLRFTLAIGLLLASTLAQADFPAKVIGITDGDTIKVLDSSNTQHKIRLAGIDAPERKQPWGTCSQLLSQRSLIYYSQRAVAYRSEAFYGHPSLFETVPF